MWNACRIYGRTAQAVKPNANANVILLVASHLLLYVILSTFYDAYLKICTPQRWLLVFLFLDLRYDLDNDSIFSLNNKDKQRIHFLPSNSGQRIKVYY